VRLVLVPGLAPEPAQGQGLELEPGLALGLGLALALVLGLAPEPAQGRHNQPPNLPLIKVPEESKLFSFSLIYLLLRFCNLSICKYLVLKTITPLL
jgi:hypothetical protein